MHIKTVIEELGYRPSEVKIYLASLDIGEATITELAQKVNMPRTSIQSIVEQMNRKGLLNWYFKKKRKYWVAENPDKLMINLKEREAALKSILPELQAKRFAKGGRPIVQLYTGAEKIKLIMDNILDTKHNILAVLSWDDLRDFFGDDYLEDFIERRKNHFLNIRLLMPKTASATQLKKRDPNENRRSRFLPEGADIKNTNFVYGNKVAIISLNKRQPIGIVMEDPDVANTMTIFFESLWNQSQEQ